MQQHTYKQKPRDRWPTYLTKSSKKSDRTFTDDPDSRILKLISRSQERRSQALGSELRQNDPRRVLIYRHVLVSAWRSACVAGRWTEHRPRIWLCPSCTGTRPRPGTALWTLGPSPDPAISVGASPPLLPSQPSPYPRRWGTCPTDAGRDRLR